MTPWWVWLLAIPLAAGMYWVKTVWVARQGQRLDRQMRDRNAGESR